MPKHTLKALAFIALVPVIAVAQTGPKYGKAGGIGSATSTYSAGEPTGGTYAINGVTGDANLNSVILRQGADSIHNLNGENVSLFTDIEAFGWDKRDGTRDAPIVLPGPSLKVSRVENLKVSQCAGIFNENACNAAIYGASAHAYNSANVTASISGTTMTVTASPPGSVLEVGQTLQATGIAPNTTITALGTGTGGIGTYTVSVSQSLSSRNIYVPNYNGMQLTGVLGTSLVYSTNPDGEGVGVQGVSRAVGGATAGIAGGYFEARYDSTAPRDYYFTVGIESRTNNLTGLDAPKTDTGGNNYIPVLATCGGGPLASAMKCNAFFSANPDSAQSWYGFLATQNSVADAAFYDASSAVDSIRISGAHTNLIKTNSNFNVSGTGRVWIGTDYNVATTHGLTVRQANGTQALFQSTGSNASVVTIDAASSGQQARLDFNDASTNKWQIGRVSNNDFYIWDNAASRNALVIPTNGTSANFGVGVKLPATTVAALPTCNAGAAGTLRYVTDASSPTWHGTLTGGGSVASGALCNGANWIAF